jgi:hypothetical protein
VKFLAKVYPLVFVASKRPKVMSFSYQPTLKKSIIDAKISCLAFKIHKSKLAIAC